MFPFESAEVKLRDGSKLELTEDKMRIGLQYGPTQGYPPLVAWLKDMMSTLHNPPTVNRRSFEGGMELCITPGCQDAICKTFEMLVGPGDNVLIDSPTYPGTLGALRPLGCNLIGVETDHQGLQPGALRQALSKWKPSDSQDPKSNIPRLLYTIPNGVNPTGAVLTLERKKEIYEIAQQYDLLILEDDPYYFLQYGSEKTPSFLSMDQDGRVIRFDSFSKVLSSGLRLGFVSGPDPLIQRVILHLMVSSMHTSSLAQVLAHELLAKWSMEGFLAHLQQVVSFYESQKDAMIRSANKWLSGLAEWNEPQAGMFLWIKIKGIADSQSLIQEKAVAKQVMFVPGVAFMVDQSQPSPHVRAAFSVASPEDMDKGLQRLAELIKEEIK